METTAQGLTATIDETDWGQTQPGRLTAGRDAEAHNDQGVAYQTVGLVSLAISEYEAAIRIDPGFADAHCNLGAALYSRGEIDSAIDEWKRAVQADPSLAQAHCNLAVAFRARGALDLAAREWGLVVALDPNDPDAHFGLGEVHEIRGEPGEAVRSYRRYAELAPPEDAHYVTVARNRIEQLQAMIRAAAGPAGQSGLPLRPSQS